jgi:hypothetical protein
MELTKNIRWGRLQQMGHVMRMEGPEGNVQMTWTGMLRGCWNSGIGGSQLMTEMPGGRGLKKPRIKFSCSAKEEEGEKN